MNVMGELQSYGHEITKIMLVAILVLVTQLVPCKLVLVTQLKIIDHSDSIRCSAEEFKSY